MGSLIGIVSGVVVVMIGWQKLDLPVPATSQEVREAVATHDAGNEARFLLIEEDGRQNQVLTLALTRGSLEQKADRCHVDLINNPTNLKLIKKCRDLDRDIESIQQQINTLNQ